MKKLYLLLLTLLPFAAQAQIPNADFENWTIMPYNELKSPWFTSNPDMLGTFGLTNVKKVPGFNGSAVRLENYTDGDDTVIAFINNALDDPMDGEGGVPYAMNATALAGYYRYNIPGDDTALIILVFKKAGVIISQDVFKIKGTGNEPAFIPFNFPVSLPQIPDSVIVAITSGNFEEYEKIEPTGWIEIDSLHLLDGVAPFYFTGSGFEDWDAKSFDLPVDWISYEGATRTTDKQSGTYAAQLTSAIDVYADTTPSSLNAQFAYATVTIDTLIGYYKATNIDGDSAYVDIWSTVGGNPGGTPIQYAFKSASSYTQFKIPLNFGSGSWDGLFMTFYSGGYDWFTTLGNTLLIDNLQIKKQSVGVKQTAALSQECKVYPSPAHDIVNIAFPAGYNSKANIIFYDVTGKAVYHKEHASTQNVLTIPVSHLANGTYYYEIALDNSVTRNKFIKE